MNLKLLCFVFSPKETSVLMNKFGSPTARLHLQYKKRHICPYWTLLCMGSLNRVPREWKGKQEGENPAYIPHVFIYFLNISCWKSRRRCAYHLLNLTHSSGAALVIQRITIISNGHSVFLIYQFILRSFVWTFLTNPHNHNKLIRTSPYTF